MADPTLTIPSRERSKKALTQLKILVETMSQLEQKTNFLLHQVLNGNKDELAAEFLNNTSIPQ